MCLAPLRSPVQGSVRLACELNHTAVGVEGMRNTNNKAWLAEAPQVGAWCGCHPWS